MRRCRLGVLGESLLPPGPGRIAEPEPVEAPFAPAPAVPAYVPVAVAADGAVVVELVLYVLLVAAHAGYVGFLVARELGTLGRGEGWGVEAGTQGA